MFPRCENRLDWTSRGSNGGAFDVTEQRAQTLSADQAAALLGKSRAWFFERVKEGHIAKEGRGRYSLIGIIRGVVAYYDDILTKQTKTQAASRATDARADEIRQRIAIRDRELIPIDEALQAQDIIVGAVNAELTGLPARVTRDMGLRRKIEDEVNGSKGRITAALRKGQAAARSGRGLDGADPEEGVR